MTTNTSTDAELLAQARKGDETAFAELYVRHEAAARRLAKAYGRAGDPDDLVNETFERVLKALRKGLGPTDAFRAYLFVTLRRLAADRIARARDEPYDEVPEPVRAAAGDPGLDPGERTLVVRAFESLPDRWQTVLWHTAVEGRAPRDLAAPLGMSANAAAALAYRAREKLRQAYLQAHLQTAPRPQCEPHRSRLGAYVRDGLGTRDRGATAAHLDDCGSCRGLVAELADVNQLLVRSLVPVFARAGEVAALLAASTAVAVAAGAATGAGVGRALRGAGDLGRRTWSKARSNPAATSAVVGALLVVAVVAGALIASRDDVALPGAPAEQATPAAPPPPPPGDEPAPPEVPMEVAPPRLAEPIVSSAATAPGTDPPAGSPQPDPARPAAPRAPVAPTTRAAPHEPATPPTTWPAAPPSPPDTEPAPTATTSPPPLAPPAPPPPPADDDEPCLLYVRIGGLLRAQICLDLPLLGAGVTQGDGG